MLNKITLPIMVHQNNIVLQNSFRETVVVMIVWYFDLQLSMPLVRVPILLMARCTQYFIM